MNDSVNSISTKQHRTSIYHLFFTNYTPTVCFIVHEYRSCITANFHDLFSIIDILMKKGGVNVQRSLHPQYHDWGALEQGTEPPTAPRAPQHKWLPTAPGVCSWCVFTAVCVHLGWDKCRAQIPSIGHHSWPYVTSLSHLLQHPGQRPPLKPLLHQFGGNVILLFDRHSSQSPPVLHQWPKKRKTFEKRKHLIKLSIFR